MKSFILSAIFALSLVPAAFAQATLDDIADMPGGTYHLDKNHATVLFKVRHMGFADYIGRFDDLSGTIDFDNAEPTHSQLNITINAASVDTNNKVMEEKLKAEDAFNVEKYPYITFTGTELVMESATAGTVTGNLTVLGKTFPVTLDVVFNGGGIHPFTKNYAMGFSASTTIDRSQWGFETWVPMVGTDVEIEIHAEFAQLGETGDNNP